MAKLSAELAVEIGYVPGEGFTGGAPRVRSASIRARQPIAVMTLAARAPGLTLADHAPADTLASRTPAATLRAKVPTSSSMKE